MNDRNALDDHREIAELIPWYVNGTIGEYDRKRLDSHVSTCAACRDDLAVERRLHEAMAAKTAVEYMPTASLKRLHAALDGLETGAAPEPKVARGTTAPAIRFKSIPWKGLAAASIAVLAVVVSFIGRESPSYHTVTNAAPRAPDEAVRAVFSPTITLVDLQAILDEAQLRIISGPSEAGVYSLAATSHRTVNTSLALLRRHPEVRFAESTQAEANARESP